MNESIEKRQYPRFAYSHTALLITKAECLKVMITDISAHGTGFTAMANIPKPEDKVKLFLLDNQTGTPIKLPGVVKYNANGHCGAQLLELDEHIKMIYHRLLMKASIAEKNKIKEA